MSLLILWLPIGLYAMFANMERVSRIWKVHVPGDSLQHLLTLVLGPIGLLLVMLTGGRWKFWEQLATSKRIQEVVSAQIWLRNGMSDQRELQLEVYEAGCNGETSVVIIEHAEFIKFLNKRRQNA